MSGAAGSILGGVLGLGGGGAGGGGASSSSSAAQASRELSRHLTSLLTEDDVQILTTLELNRLATYSYHVDSLVAVDNDLLETMMVVLQTVLSKPAQYSTVALLKALAVTDWLLTYGSDRVLMEAKALGRPVEVLQSYNTVLLAQQSSGATALLMRIKGGGVDQGGPVRAKADRVMRMLSDPAFYQMERSDRSDPGSLVPVGSAKKVGFVTDEVRLHLLRRRMNEEEAKSRIKSNLQKPEGGFGSGYNSRDGKSVVGAAHGIEEMLKMAQKEKDRFVDGEAAQGTPVVDAHGDLLPGFAVGGGGGNGATSTSSSHFSEYRAPSLVGYYAAAPPPTYAQPAAPGPPDVDLLDFSADNGSGAPTAGPVAVATATTPSFDEDLLGMSSSMLSDPNSRGGADDHSLLSYPPGPLLMDLGAAPSASSDCLMAAASTTSSMSTVVTSNDLLGGSSLGPTSAAAPATATTISTTDTRDPFGGADRVAVPAAAPTLSGLLGSLSLGRSAASATYSTPSIDVTPKLPEATTSAPGLAMMGTGAYPSAPAMSATTTSSHGSFDRFAALDVLAGTAPATASTGTGLAVSGTSVGWNLSPYATAGYATNRPAMAPTASFPSSSSHAWSNNGSDRGAKSTSDGGGGGGNGFVMGGTAGAGLFPLGPAPATPPPPPPPPAGASTFPFY